MLYTSKNSWEHVQFIFIKKKYNFLPKNAIFFNFFNFSDTLEDPKNFRISFFQKFQKKKKNSQNDFHRTWQILKGTKSWILVSLSLTPWKRRTESSCPGHNASPCGIGLKFTKSSFASIEFQMHRYEIPKPSTC